MVLANRKVYIAFLMLFMLTVTLFGCTEPQIVGSGQVAYTTEFAQSEMEYGVFLDKEIVPITNELTTQILLAKRVMAGSYPIQDAIDSAKASLEKIEECIAKVDTMNPPEQDESVRVAVLKSMQNCKDDIETYIKELESGKMDEAKIEELRKIMQADYIALTGNFQ